MYIQTGYYANETSWTKVHLVIDGKPACGALIKNKSFQFCSVGITLKYIECKKCKAKALSLTQINHCRMITPDVNLLFVGDKVIETYISLIPNRTESERELTVGRITKTFAFLTDGIKLIKVKRDISNGVRVVPKENRAFRSSWYEYKV